MPRVANFEYSGRSPGLPDNAEDTMIDIDLGLWLFPWFWFHHHCD
jgi:hypothetical protein